MNKRLGALAIVLLFAVAGIVKAAEDFTVENSTSGKVNVMIFGTPKGEWGTKKSDVAGLSSFRKLYHRKLKPGEKWRKNMGSRMINLLWSADGGATWSHVRWDSKNGQVNMKIFYITGQRQATGRIGRAGIPNYQNVNFMNLMPVGVAELKKGGFVVTKERPAKS